MVIVGVILGQLLGAIGVCVYLNWFLRREKNELRERLSAIVSEWTATDGEKPSKVAMLTDVAGETVGRAAARALMQQIGTANSHASRAANAVVAEAEGASNPLMSILAGAGGPRGKNAGMLRLAQMLAPMLQNSGNGSNQSGPSIRDRLRGNGG